MKGLKANMAVGEIWERQKKLSSYGKGRAHKPESLATLLKRLQSVRMSHPGKTSDLYGNGTRIGEGREE
jgi:alpha-D-ribose 1-methylphosphonate 5-triphosphate synthase subunit PhnH